MTTRQAGTSDSTTTEIPRGWRAYQLPGGVPLLALLVPLAGIVLLFLLLTGRLVEGPSAQERAGEAAESVAAALALPVDSLEQVSRTAPCPGGGDEGSTVAEHVLRTPASSDGAAVLQDRGVTELTADALTYFNLNAWGHRRYVAGDDRVVRGAREDQAALVTLTADSVEIRVVVGPCAAEALPEPGPPFQAG